MLNQPCVFSPQHLIHQQPIHIPTLYLSSYQQQLTFSDYQSPNTINTSQKILTSSKISKTWATLIKFYSINTTLLLTPYRHNTYTTTKQSIQTLTILQIPF